MAHIATWAAWAAVAALMLAATVILATLARFC